MNGLVARRIVLALALAAAWLPGGVGAQSADWNIPAGHFYTQTGGSGGKGYAVTDADGVGFWSAFQALGGVDVVGYPVSQRFVHGGFVTQAMQKAVFQWRPESKSVNFVNVFDDLSAANKDQFLLEVRQTPRAAPFPSEAGKAFDDVVKIRQAALDARPAMKAVYFAAANPVLQYGLPTSQVTDMGNHYAIRLQRAVIQEWKQDVPWARAGQATVANGGDIGKEAGLWPAAALSPADAGTATAAAPAQAATPAAGSSTAADGAWSGQTDRSEAVNFTVGGGGTKVTSLTLSVPIGSNRCAVGLDLGFRDSNVPIQNGSFSGTNREGTFTFEGTFTSPTTATGTYTLKDYDLSRSQYQGSSYRPTDCGAVNQTGAWKAKI